MTATAKSVRFGSLLTLMLTCLVTFPAVTHAASVTNQRVTTVAPPASTCVVPPSTPSFTTSDNTVYLYFEASVTASDALYDDWIGPSGQRIAGGNWSSIIGTYCFTGASLNITNTPTSLLGQWQARVWDNGAVLFTVPFTITAPSGTSTAPFIPSPPSVTTSQRTLPLPTTDTTIYAYSATVPVLVDNMWKPNPFYEGGAWNCTRYAWGRAVEKIGVALAFKGGPGNQNAGQWYQDVVSQGTVSLGPTSSPRPNSIAVWTGGDGHVAFVEDINTDGSLILTEANYPSGSSPHQTTLPPSQITSRSGENGTVLQLVGYIYLTGYEGYVDTNSNTCSTTVSGWIVNHYELNTPLEVDIFDGETYLSSTYANAWREDVSSYLGNSGFNAFRYPIPAGLSDGQAHQLWARVSGTYTDAAHTQAITCKAGGGNLQITFAPSYVTGPATTPTCSSSFQFALSATETNGLGMNLSTLSITPEGYNWNLPALGLPNSISAGGTIATSLVWCRSPGISTFTITGTDDAGHAGSWSGTVTFALQ